MNEWFPQRGYRKFNRMTIRMANPRLWSAEVPNLYTLRLQLQDAAGRNIEQTSLQVGFRQINIRGGQLLINGTPIKGMPIQSHEHQSSFQIIRAANSNSKTMAVG
jgi:beta-galactosidase